MYRYRRKEKECFADTFQKTPEKVIAENQKYLPDKAYKGLAVHTVNSNIDVPKDFTFEKTNIHTVNGKISLNCSVTEWVSAETTNGAILLTGEISGKIHADTVNGNIDVKEK